MCCTGWSTTRFTMSLPRVPRAPDVRCRPCLPDASSERRVGTSAVRALLLSGLVVLPLLANGALAATRAADAASGAASAATGKVSGRATAAGVSASASRLPRAVPHAASAAASSAGRAALARPVAKPVRLVDINSASAADLMKLPGVGKPEAERIMAGRPYRTSADLATRNVLPAGSYLALRRSIVAMPPGVAGKDGSVPKPVASKAAGTASAAGRGVTP